MSERDLGGGYFRPIHCHCWARRGDAEIFCVASIGPTHIHFAADDVPRPEREWRDHQCAPDGGPGERETVAHQILELSWHADFMAFRRGEGWGEPGSPSAPRLRAIAARLRVDTRAAPTDFERIVRDGRALLAAARELGVDAPTATSMIEDAWLLNEAAWRLVPFVGVPDNQGSRTGGENE